MDQAAVDEIMKDAAARAVDDFDSASAIAEANPLASFAYSLAGFGRLLCATVATDS